MKNLLIFLFLFPSIVFAQIEFGQDTTQRPSKTTTTRQVIKDNNFYFVPKTGNVIQGVTSLKRFSEFTTYKGQVASYDGSNWMRLSGINNTTATIGYGTMCTASVNGYFYARVVEYGINARWFGLKGDGNTTTNEMNRETAAMKKFIAFVCAQNNPLVNGAFSPYGNYAGTAIIPQGSYSFNDEIPIPGSISIKMDEGTAYGGTNLIQISSNKHLFHLKPDNDGSSSAVSITGGKLIDGSGANSGKALIFGGHGTGEANNSSFYCTRVSFRATQGYSINVENGDDIKILDCTNDVNGLSCYSFGHVDSPVTNLTISRNTFFAIALTAINLVNVRNASIIDNKMYQVDGDYRNNIFVNALGIISNLTIALNQTRNIDTFCLLASDASGIDINHNTLQNSTGRLLYVSGGNITYGARVKDNTITSATSFTLSPIEIVGSGWQYSQVKDNTFFSLTGNASVPAILMNDNRTINNNLYPNIFINFPTSYSVNSPSTNGYNAPQGTLAQQNASSVSVGTLTSTSGITTNTLSTSTAIASSAYYLIDNNNGMDITSGQPITTKGYHGVIVQNNSGGNSPALQIKGQNPAQHTTEFYNASGVKTFLITQQGALPRYVTTTQRDAISSPIEGVIVYNTTTHTFEFYNGSVWKTVTTN